MQTDPIGNEDQVNLCAYVSNDPVNYTDPTGQQMMYWDVDHSGTPEANAKALAVMEAAVDFVPLIGDGKGIAEAIADPSPINVAAGIVGIVGPVGDAAAVGIKGAAKTVEVGDRVRGVAAGTGRAADRAALRDAGVPTSRSRSDVKRPDGRPVPKAERQQMTQDSRGNPVVVSRHQPHPGGGKTHDSKPHSHAATPHIDDGELVTRRDGSIRYHN